MLGKETQSMKWILGACIVAVVAGVVATMTVPAQTITPDETTLKLLPQDLQGIAFIDVAGLRNATLIQDLLQKQGFPGVPQDFMDATGIQPLRDIDKATIGIGSKPVVILEARYDRFKVEQYLQNQGAASETYLGRTLYSPQPQQPESITFIDRYIVAGDTDLVKQVVDRMAAPAANVLQNAALMEMIRRIETGNQVWLVGANAGTLTRSVPAPPEVQNILTSLTSGSYQMRIAQDVHVKAIGNFSTNESARNSADMLRGLIALARTQTAQQPDLLHLLDGVRVEDTGNLMTIQIDAPGDLLKNFQPRKVAELVR